MTNEERIKKAQEILLLIKDENLHNSLDEIMQLEKDDRDAVMFIITMSVIVQLNNHPFLNF